jgi:hypothetical protein
MGTIYRSYWKIQWMALGFFPFINAAGRATFPLQIGVAYT